MSKFIFILKLISITILLFKIQSSDQFRFQRQINCSTPHINDTNSKMSCKDWSQTTTLYQYSFFIYYCFPGDSWVLTSDGPVQMNMLTVQDQIFSMNLQTGKNQFTSILAWLHYDPFSLIDYSYIQIQNSTQKFIGSKYHNIGFSNLNQTDFKFLKDLNNNDSLISFSKNNKNLTVKNTQNTIQKEGLFSPLTNTGTFYIFPNSFDQIEYNDKNEDYPMILVHSLSQIKNPTQNFQKAYTFTKLSQIIFGPYQPPSDDQYVNPLISQFSIIFGSDWIEVQGQKIAHRYSSSYSSTRNRKRQERKRKTMAVLAVQNILSDTLL